MIVSKSAAEVLLGKKLETLGDKSQKHRGKRSYYVLSESGAKNLGGPYTKDQAKERLRQVEAFKHLGNRKWNPSKSFSDREHNWKEVLIHKGRKRFTRKQILKHYEDNRKKIWPHLKNQMVMVIIAPSKNRFVRRRKTGSSPETYIHLTKLDGIEDPKSFEYWINRRTVEFHPVISGASTDRLWVDLDMHKTKNKANKASLLRKMKASAPKIKKVMRSMGVSRPIVYNDGAGGIHIEGKLVRKKNVNKLRRDFRAALSAAFEDDPVFTTGLAGTGQIRLDTTTLHRLGSLRAPYSFSISGEKKVPL